MTILVLQLSEQMARRVAEAADREGLASNEDVGLRALDQYLGSVLGKVRGRKPMSEATKTAAQKTRHKRG